MDNSQETRRARLKLAATLRAQLAYEQACARIDHKIDVQDPALRRFDAEIEAGKVPKELSQ
jgi:hypothetical protein